MRSIKLETSGFSRGLPVPSRVGQINALSNFSIYKMAELECIPPPRTHPRRGLGHRTQNHIATERTVKQILNCKSGLRRMRREDLHAQLSRGA